LEIAVCAQHNNGGLAANAWWESVNVKHLFPVGEVNGSHGVYRPGGSALNSGQVGGYRAADYIAALYAGWSLDLRAFQRAAAEVVSDWQAWLDKCRTARTDGEREREELQARMSRAGAHIRDPRVIEEALREAWAQGARLEASGCAARSARERAAAAINRQLCLAQGVYLEALRFAMESGVGSRGSAMVRDPRGQAVHPRLGEEWRFAAENPAFREQVQETWLEGPGQVANRWVPCRPLPETAGWFETSWAAYRDGKIYE